MAELQAAQKAVLRDTQGGCSRKKTPLSESPVQPEKRLLSPSGHQQPRSALEQAGARIRLEDNTGAEEHLAD